MKRQNITVLQRITATFQKRKWSFYPHPVAHFKLNQKNRALNNYLQRAYCLGVLCQEHLQERTQALIVQEAHFYCGQF